jgi:hypothetical protein
VAAGAIAAGVALVADGDLAVGYIEYVGWLHPVLIPAKLNWASTWANHTADRSAQNGGSRTATVDTSADELHVPSILRRGHQMWVSMSICDETAT